MKHKTNRLFVLPFALLAMIYGGCNLGGSSNNTPDHLPRRVKDLASVGIKLTTDGGVVGGKLSQAWCEELKSGQHPFDVYEFSPLMGKDKTRFDALVTSLAKKYVGDGYSETSDAVSTIYSKQFGDIEKRLVVTKDFGRITFVTMRRSLTPVQSNGTTVQNEQLFAKVRTFIGEYLPPTSSTQAYYVTDFDADVGGSGGAPLAYTIALEWMDQSVPISDSSAHELTSATFHFNTNGELDNFSFTPATLSKSADYSKLDIMSPDKAIEQAKQSSGITDASQYEMTCFFDYRTAWRSSDKKVYFIPVYAIRFKPKEGHSLGPYVTGKIELVVATGNPKVKTELALNEPTPSAGPDSGK